jgi:poly(3-hydroxybutyrate) depolymerase
MPDSLMTLFPQILNQLELMKIPVQLSADLTAAAIHSQELAFGLMKNNIRLGGQGLKHFLPLMAPNQDKSLPTLIELIQEGSSNFLSAIEKNISGYLRLFYQERAGELEFLNLFTQKQPPQGWTVEYDPSRVLLDLPSLKLIDISREVDHTIQNYGVVFAPRAGHHSNIAERVALFMRDQGLTRMAVVEQKSAEEIPLMVEGKRHHENFEGQVDQYRKILEHLQTLTGKPPHLIAICQPGPLLMTTLILNPHLGKTFGSAGAPMHTEAERGFLTDFARLMGEDYIDRLLTWTGRTVPEGYPGAGREVFDGRIQVLGFYLLGLEQHYKNLTRLLQDLKKGDEEAGRRQKAFYEWYNTVLHFPAGFIRDTFKKVFVNNELVRGTLVIEGKRVSLKDYPGGVPIWALGGSKDDIAPPLQAIGHMDLLESVPSKDKLKLVCDGGHMALFRSNQILKKEYKQICEFILERSDWSDTIKS